MNTVKAIAYAEQATQTPEYATVRERIATAMEAAAANPDDATAQIALDAAIAELDTFIECAWTAAVMCDALGIDPA